MINSLRINLIILSNFKVLVKLVTGGWFNWNTCDILGKSICMHMMSSRTCDIFLTTYKKQLLYIHLYTHSLCWQLLYKTNLKYTVLLYKTMFLGIQESFSVLKNDSHFYFEIYAELRIMHLNNSLWCVLWDSREPCYSLDWYCS